MVFGRQMRDFIPSLTYKYEPAKDWAVCQEHRERTLANKREMDHQRWSHRTKDLDELEVGTAVAIQNQTGPNPTKVGQDGHHYREQAQQQGHDQGHWQQACHLEKQKVCKTNGDYSEDHHKTSTSKEEAGNTTNHQTRTA